MVAHVEDILINTQRKKKNLLRSLVSTAVNQFFFNRFCKVVDMEN